MVGSGPSGNARGHPVRQMREQPPWNMVEIRHRLYQRGGLSG
jgi:hypothetical protein